jgi:tRNA(Ile)-lysidine synthase
VTRKAGPAAELDPRELFRGLADARGLVLAVSGGPDSTALMVLVARWDERPPTLVISVDHGLRPQASEEARLASANATKLGLKARVLKAPERYESGNLQDWARRTRYRLLAQAARENGFDTIVTAHHRDDQAETFLLRLARGSGVFGLAAMAEENCVEGVRVVRPLLAVARETLGEIAKASRLLTVSDPSNVDLRFDRVRMRELMPALAKEGLTPARLSETAGRMRRAAAALDHFARRLLIENFQVDRFGVVRGDATALAKVPEEVSLRALALLLQAVGGAEYTPELESITAFREAILAPAPTGIKRTLHGTVVDVRRAALVARREWGRTGLASVSVQGETSIIWDRRFEVCVPRLSGALEVGPLGRAQRRLSSEAADRVTLQTLPGLFRNGTLAATPAGVIAEESGVPVVLLKAESLVGQRLAGKAVG